MTQSPETPSITKLMITLDSPSEAAANYVGSVEQQILNQAMLELIGKDLTLEDVEKIILVSLGAETKEQAERLPKEIRDKITSIENKSKEGNFTEALGHLLSCVMTTRLMLISWEKQHSQPNIEKTLHRQLILELACQTLLNQPLLPTGDNFTLYETTLNKLQKSLKKANSILGFRLSLTFDQILKKYEEQSLPEPAGTVEQFKPGSTLAIFIECKLLMTALEMALNNQDMNHWWILYEDLITMYDQYIRSVKPLQPVST